MYPVQPMLVNTDWAMNSPLINPNGLTARGRDKYWKSRAKKSCRSFFEESKEIWINVPRVLVMTNM